MNHTPFEDHSVSVGDGTQPKKAMSPKTRKKLLLAGIALLLIIAVIGINLAVTLLPRKWRTAAVVTDSVYGLSSATKNILSALGEDVELYLICENGEIGANQSMLLFLQNYEMLSDRVSVQVLDIKEDADFLAEMGIGDLSQTGDSFVLVRSARRQRLMPVSQMEYYDCPDLDLTLTPAEYAEAEYQEFFAQNGTAVYHYFRGEKKVTNALQFVSREDVPVVAVVSAAFQDTDGSVIMLNENIGTDLTEQIEDHGFEIRYILSVADLTDDHEILIFNSPLLDLSEREQTNLSAWLARGGNMFLTTLYYTREQPRLEAVLAEYGLSADEDGKYVCLAEGSSHNLITPEVNTAAIYSINTQTGMASGETNGAFAVNDFHKLSWDPDRTDVNVTRWLHTSGSGFRKAYNIKTETWTQYSEAKNVYYYGLLAEKNTSRVAWLASPDALSDIFNDYSFGGNHSLTLATLVWMAENQGTLAPTEIKATSMDVAPLQITFTSFYFWGAVLIAVIPLAFLTVGGIRIYIRKKR